MASKRKGPSKARPASRKPVHVSFLAVLDAANEHSRLTHQLAQSEKRLNRVISQALEDPAITRQALADALGMKRTSFLRRFDVPPGKPGRRPGAVRVDR